MDNANSLDWGVEDQKTEILVKKEPLNPFFLGLENELSKKKMGELYEISDRILVICLRNNFENNKESFETVSKLFDRKISTESLNKLSTVFVLVESSIQIIKNKCHMKELLLIDRCNLNYLNKDNKFKLNNNELVLLKTEFKEKDVNLYCKLHSGLFNMNDVSQIMTMKDYDNLNTFKNFGFTININTVLNNIKEVTYWEDNYRCNIDINELFYKRKFNYQTNISWNILGGVNASKDRNWEIKSITEKLEIMPSEGEDYLKDIFRKDLYVDLSNARTDKQNRTLYRITEMECKMDNNIVNKMFKMLKTSREKYNLFNSFLVSKDYWHLVLNNTDILEDMLPVIKKYKPLYKYLLGYPILTAKMEESIKKTRILTNDRFVFPIDVASLISDFEIPYSHDDLHNTPFFPLLVSKKLINCNNTYLGTPLISGSSNRISTLKEFKQNFNIFTSGIAEIGVFDDLNWDNIAISGSCIPACVPKNDILMNVVNQDSSHQNNFQRKQRYNSEYFSDSDVDIMVNLNNVLDFIKKVDTIIECVKKNIVIMKGVDNTHTLLKMNAHKSLTIIVSKEYIENYMEDFKLDYVLQNLSTSEIKERFFELYFIEKMKQNSSYRKKLKEYDIVNKCLTEEFFKTMSIDDLNIIISEDEIYSDSNNNFDNEIIYTRNHFISSSEKKLSFNEDKCILKIAESVKYKV